MKFIIHLIITTIAMPTFAISWAPQSHILKSHELLPVGETVAGIVFQSRTDDGSYNSDGEKQTFGFRNRQELNLSSGKAYRTYEVEMQQMRFTPSWAFGLTKNWTLAAKLPIIKISANIKQKIVNESTERSESISFSPHNKTSRFSEANGSVTRSRIGQFEVISKHALMDTYKSDIVIYESLKLPTSENEDLDYFLYSEPPSQAYAAGLGTAIQYKNQSKWALQAQAELTHHFSDSVYAQKSDGYLTEERLQRQQGQEIFSELANQWYLNKTAVRLGYRYQYQFESEFEDSAEDLVDLENQMKSSMFLSLAWNHFPIRRGKDLSAHFEWENVLAGENVQGGDTFSLGVSSNF